MGGEQGPEQDAEHGEGSEADEQEAEHGQPLAGREPHPERRSGQAQHHDRQERHEVAAEQLRAEVGTRPERGDPQLTRPPQGALGGDARTGRYDGDTRADARHARHEVEGKADAIEGMAPLRARDRKEQDERPREREDDEPHVPEVPQHLVAEIGRASHRTSMSWAVSARNASSSPAPRTSTSRAAGNRSSRARSAVSASRQVRITPSPRRSALITPGSAPSCGTAAPGSVARIVRPPTLALISVAGPSATICPRARRTTRSPTASASSRQCVAKSTVLPRAATACVGGIPNSETLPESGRVRPSTMSIVVVLPAPFGPRNATVSPGAIIRSIERTARTSP